MSDHGDKKTRIGRVTSSMLWAAWADALGFITELANEERVSARLKGRDLREPLAWFRRVGGRFGVDVELPAGTYSDDTQLRIATGRAISGNGFDVEAFARIELTVWPSYALGGGRASKAAAANLAKRSTPWFGNFFDGWSAAGGNGVAMRIQPHVWAAPRPATVGSHLLDVLVNGITTHGHPRALVGAAIHAAALGLTLESGHVPPPDLWGDVLSTADRTLSLVDDHSQLSSMWRPSWERGAKETFASAWSHTVEECRAMFTAGSRFVRTVGPDSQAMSLQSRAAYEDLVLALDLTNPATRGSGTATVVAALALAAAFPQDPAGCAVLAAHALGTDTDTIGSMSAAVAGATRTGIQPSPVMDHEYLVKEGTRLASLGFGGEAESFSYPDLLEWIPPRSQLESVGTTERGRPALAGLGLLEPSLALRSTAGKSAIWSWMRSDFGQTFLVKHRSTLRPLAKANYPVRHARTAVSAEAHGRGKSQGRQLSLEGPGGSRTDASDEHAEGSRHGMPEGDRGGPQERLDLDEALAWLRSHQFADSAVGSVVRQICHRGSVEQLLIFVGVLRGEIRHRSSGPGKPIGDVGREG